MTGFKNNNEFVVKLSWDELCVITSALEQYVEVLRGELEEGGLHPEVAKMVHEEIHNGSALFDALEKLA